MLLLAVALGLVGVGLFLAVPGAVLAGSLLLAVLLEELLRLRAGLKPMNPPWGVLARLEVDKVDRDKGLAFDQPRVPSMRAGKPVPLQMELRVPASFAGLRLDLHEWWTSPGLELTEGAHRSLQLRSGTAVLRVQTVPHIAAIHRVFGVQGLVTDAHGLVCASVFLPCPCELAVLPKSLPLDLRQVAETRRRSPRVSGGQRPDKMPGAGDELRELREHAPGDPFKHIAWKATAARGQLMSRSFDRERTRALHVILETGATMRDGRPGKGPLDQALDLVHSLAEVCARTHDPFGINVVDGRVVDQRPVLEGLAALREVDRALLELRRTVAEDLAPMDDDELFQVVVRYLTAIERVPLPSASNDPVARLRHRQRAVMAALARLPERERLPWLRGPDPSPRPDIAILRRFCRAMDLPLPYRAPISPQLRVDGLIAGLQAASAQRKGPFFLVLVSDFRRFAGVCGPLWQACARVQAAGHRVLAVAVREFDDRDVLDMVGHAQDIDTAVGLVRADSAARAQLLHELAEGARKVGVRFLPDPQPRALVAMWKE